MARPTEAILSKQNLLHNIQWIRNKVGKSKIIAMVKANAYGHGIRSVSQHIAPHVDMLGVASIDEAMALRNVGIDIPIMLAEGVFNGGEWEIAAKYRCQIVIHHIDQIHWLENLIHIQPIRVWLKVNTGMNRLGFKPNQVQDIYQRLVQNPSVEKPIGLMSHFASSENILSSKTQQQSKQFWEMVGHLKPSPGQITLCNSGGIIHRPNDYADYVRPGLLMHGISPTPGTTGSELGLRPVMRLQSQLISVYIAHKGDEIGYGGHYVCPETMPIGIAAIGYGDGYPYSASTGTPILVNGQPCQLIGKVSMDMLAIDLRLQPNAKVQDIVTLWGQNLPVETVASFTRDIPHTLLTGLHHRVHCRWEDNPAE